MACTGGFSLEDVIGEVDGANLPNNPFTGDMLNVPMSSCSSFLPADLNIEPPIPDMFSDTQTLIGQFTERAAAASAQGMQAVTQIQSALQGLISGLNPPQVSANVNLPNDGVTIRLPAPPPIDPVEFVEPAAPAAISYDIPTPPFPAFQATPPDLQPGDRPSADIGIAPSSPPVSLNFDAPNISVEIPSAPSLLSLSQVVPPQLNMPIFQEILTPFTEAYPEITPYAPRQLAVTSEVQTIQQELIRRISNGQALPPEVEAGFWDRAREREYRQMEAALSDLDRMEAFGYSAPSGVYMAARLKLQTEMGYNAANINREIMIKQAELQLKSITESLPVLAQLESKILDIIDRAEQRIFEAARYRTEASINVYNAKVRVYTANVEAYKAKIAIYEAMIRSLATQAEIYKTQVEAESVKANINKTLIDQYKVQTEVALSAIDIFKAQVEMVRVKAELEKTKVQIFGEQIKAYAARASVYAAQMEGYKASVQAEVSKQEAYRSQIEAFKAQVDGVAKQADVEIEKLKAKAQVKTAEWEGYKAKASGQAEKVRAVASSNQTKADMFKAIGEVDAAFITANANRYRALADAQVGAAQVAVANAKQNAEAYMAARTLAVEAAKAGATVAGQIAAAQINATGATMSYSASDSNSKSHSHSTGSTRSMSHNIAGGCTTSTNYNYGATSNYATSYNIGYNQSTNLSRSISGSTSNSYSCIQQEIESITANI